MTIRPWKITEVKKADGLPCDEMNCQFACKSNNEKSIFHSHHQKQISSATCTRYIDTEENENVIIEKHHKTIKMNRLLHCSNSQTFLMQ